MGVYLLHVQVSDNYTPRILNERSRLYYLDHETSF